MPPLIEDGCGVKLPGEIRGNELRVTVECSLFTRCATTTPPRFFFHHTLAQPITRISPPTINERTTINHHQHFSNLSNSWNPFFFLSRFRGENCRFSSVESETTNRVPSGSRVRKNNERRNVIIRFTLGHFSFRPVLMRTTKNQRRRIVSFPRPKLTGRTCVLNRIVLSCASSSFTDIRRLFHPRILSRHQ